MPPKGWKKTSKLTDDPVIVHSNQSPVSVVEPGYFEVGSWYKPSDQQPVVIDACGRPFKWSLIKFKVVRVVGGIVAVQFEDYSFEAMVDPDFSNFEPAQAPRY